MACVVDVERLEAVAGSREEAMTEAMIAAVILPGGVIEAGTGAEHEGIRHIKSTEVIEDGLGRYFEQKRIFNQLGQ